MMEYLFTDIPTSNQIIDTTTSFGQQWLATQFGKTKLELQKREKLILKNNTHLANIANTNEQTLASWVIQGGQFNTLDDTLRLKFYGRFASNTHVKTLKVKIGSVAEFDTSGLTLIKGCWEIEFSLDALTSTAQFLRTKLLNIDNVTPSSFWPYHREAATAYDFTADVSMSITCQTDTSAAGDILLDGLEFLYIKAPQNVT